MLSEEEESSPNIFEDLNDQNFLQTLHITGFKRFKKLELDLSNNVVIAGANGSGKTSLLWACLLFLHGYNMRSGSSKKNTTNPINMRKYIAELIAHPAFKIPEAEYASFINPDFKEATLVGTFAVSKLKFEFSIKANGEMNFYLPENQHNLPKIRFAFSTPQFVFEASTKEVYGVENIFTSCQQNLRLLWSQLKAEPQEKISSIMSNLFGIKTIKKGEDKDLLIVESSGYEIEAAFAGSAMQRVLSTEILFQTLLSLPESQRVFFIEEPETYLYPSLVYRYIDLLYTRAMEANIQLIVTSNSPVVMQRFPSSERRVLSSISPEWISPIKQDLEVSLITASLCSERPILLLDGVTDVSFITSVFPCWMKKYQLIARKGRDDKSIEPLIKYARAKNIPIAWLRDREFIMPNLIEYQLKNDTKELGIPVFCWELPCIESYVILNSFLQKPNKSREEVQKYMSLLENSVQYYLGVTQGVKKLAKDLPKADINYYWNLAQQELKNESPNWQSVVEVIHGHTWMAGEIEPRHLKDLHLDVKALLGITRSTIESVLPSIF